RFQCPRRPVGQRALGVIELPQQPAALVAQRRPLHVGDGGQGVAGGRGESQRQERQGGGEKAGHGGTPGTTRRASPAGTNVPGGRPPRRSGSGPLSGWGAGWRRGRTPPRWSGRRSSGGSRRRAG